MSKMAQLILGALALAFLAGPALADGVNPPPCKCRVVHHHHHAPPPPVRVVYVPAPPPPCDGRWEHDEEGRWGCIHEAPPVEAEQVSLNADFFADTGGVGPDVISYGGGGGGGGFAEAGASSEAFASASASANVSVRFRGGYGRHTPPPPHGGGGCGCSSHGKW